jgi:hypothetical protein
MPSQEFYAILVMIIYPDVVEPELLRDNAELQDESVAGAARAALPFLNFNPN